jgi:hypothetical protein
MEASLSSNVSDTENVYADESLPSYFIVDGGQLVCELETWMLDKKDEISANQMKSDRYRRYHPGGERTENDGSRMPIKICYSTSKFDTGLPSEPNLA